jgi:hypothetical protein
MKLTLLKSLLSIILLFSAITSLSTKANTIVAACHDCSDYRMRSAALKAHSRINLTGGTSGVFVFDYKRGKYQKYFINQERDGGVYLAPISATAKEKEVFSKGKKSYNDAIATLRWENFTTELDYSPYEIERTGAYVNKIIDDYKQNASAIRKLNNAFGLFFSQLRTSIFHFNNLALHIKINLPNNSGSILFVINGTSSDGDLLFEVLEIIDADGNIVPSNKVDFFRNTYIFEEPQNAREWREHADFYGVRVDGRLGGPRGSVIIIDCGSSSCAPNPN